MRFRQSLLLLAVPILAASCTNSGDQAPDSAPSSAAKADCHKDSPLKSVDKGWSLTTSHGAKRETVSFAAVVENTSDTHEVTRNGTIHVEFLDGSGEQIGGQDETDPGMSQSFDLRGLAPGARSAVTGTAMLSQAPDQVKITTAGACVRDTGSRKDAIEVQDAQFSAAGETLTVDLDLSSTLEGEHDGGAILVFRDTKGDVVGGGPYPGVSGTAPTLTKIPHGESHQRVEVNVADFVPDDANLDSTSVYIGLL